MSEAQVQEPVLNRVNSIRASGVTGVLVVNVDLTDIHGNTYTTDYGSHPDDPHGINPVLRAWLVANAGKYTILPYIPPTVEQSRANMPNLSARQFWMAAMTIGVTKQICIGLATALPETTPEEIQDKQFMLIEINDSTTFERSNPRIESLSTLLGITPVQLDSLWLWAFDNFR